MTKLENALIWLYVKSWGKFGEHVLKQDIWKFADRDIEGAIMGLAYPRKRKSDEKETTERVQALNDLIMGRFEEGGIDAFRKWSFEIHAQVFETLPINAVDKQVMINRQQQIKKILKWDDGKYSRLYFSFIFKIDNIFS